MRSLVVTALVLGMVGCGAAEPASSGATAGSESTHETERGHATESAAPDAGAPEPAPVTSSSCAADTECPEGSLCVEGACSAACAEGAPESVAFAFDESTLRSDQASVLDAAALCLRARRSATIEVTGCVANDEVCSRPRRCEHYSEEYAMALGDRMARAVRDGLEQRGISRARVTTRSAYETCWVCTDETPECRDRNRRAILELR